MTRASAFCLAVGGLIMAGLSAAGYAAEDGAAKDSASGRFVYVSLAGDRQIAVFRQDAGDGTLTEVSRHDVDAAPGSMAFDARRRVLYVALRTASQLGSFQVDRQTGKLTPLSTTDANGSAAYVATDQTGRYLLSAYYQQGKVAVHGIDADGRLSEKPLQTVPTAKNAHCIITDPANRFAFVPHTGPNAVVQFRFDAKTGQLSPNQPPRLQTADQTGPRHIWFHPTLKMAYFDQEQGSAVTACRYDAEAGTLQPVQTLSTLPDDFDENNTCADIEVHPSGKFVYSSNRGHDSIAGFSVNPESGRLTALGQTPTEKTPRSFNIDPSGRWLYAGGQGSGKLAAYSIDQESGNLKQFATYEVGKQPAWVQFVVLGE